MANLRIKNSKEEGAAVLVVIKNKKINDPTIEKIKSKIKNAKRDLLKAQKDLTHWKSVSDMYGQLFRKHIKPELEKLSKVRKSWVLQLYEARHAMRWNKLEIELLDEEIVSKALDLLDDLPGDPELEAIVEKYKDALQSLADEEDLDPLDQSFLEMLAQDICSTSNLPKDFFKDCQSEKEMYDRYTQFMDDQEETTRTEKQSSGKKFTSEVIKSLYRRLASLLHPDKETDPVLKQTKTELMQRLNNAYRNNNIDELMQIQKEIDIPNPTDLMSDLEGLTANLNAIKKQRKDLTSEVNEIKKWFKTQIDPELLDADTKKLEPYIRNSFKGQIMGIKQEITQLESDINYTFKDQKGIKNILRYL